MGAESAPYSTLLGILYNFFSLFLIILKTVYFHRAIIVVFLFFLLSSCAERGSLVRSRSNFHNDMKDEKIAILPIITKVEIVDIAGKKYNRPEYEEYLIDLLPPILLEELSKHSINSKIITQKEIQYFGLDKDYINLQDKNEEILSHLYFKKKLSPHMAYNTAANFDIDLSNFIKNTGCNILILLKYDKIIQTNGARMRNFMLSFINGLDGGKTTAESGDLSVIAISIIDARSSDLLWSHLTLKQNDPYKLMSNQNSDIDRISKLINQSLKPLNTSEQIIPSRKGKATYSINKLIKEALKK